MVLSQPSNDRFLPPVAERFLRYVAVETTANPNSDDCPSSPGQLELGRILRDELIALGADQVHQDRNGYVYATIPAANSAPEVPVIGLLAHLDTSPDASASNVRPVIHYGYDGSPIRLPGNANVVLDPDTRPELLNHVGEDIITADGTTLLGSDDKAGVAVIMQLADELLNSPDLPRPTVRIVFTVDEEIGRGVDRLDLTRFGAAVAYTLDGSGVDRLYADTFNAARAVIDLTGVMTHPGYAAGVMVNAATIGAEIVGRLPATERPENTSGDQGYYYVQSFVAESMDVARIVVLLRDFSHEGLEGRKSTLRKLCSAAQSEYPRSKIAVQIEDQYKNMRSYIRETDERAITYAIDAGRSLGIDLIPERIRGGTDGARLSEIGIPTPNIFDGGRDYHSLYEWNTVQNLERSLLFVTALLARWAHPEVDAVS